MIILLAYAAVVLLFVLDRMKKIELGHPVWVLLTAAGYFCSTLWHGAALTLLALVQTVEGTGVSALLAWGRRPCPPCRGPFGALRGGEGQFLPPGPGPGGRAGSARRADSGLRPGAGHPAPGAAHRRLWVCGGLPPRGLSGAAVDASSHPLVLAALWPMLHLVFHVALVAIVLDPLILLAAFLIGVLRTVQEIFLLHGLIRGCVLVKKRPGALALHILLGLVPAVNLILAIRLRLALRADAWEEVSV